jgi:hypothetical protein
MSEQQGEEGNKVDGSEVSGVPDSVQYLTTVKITTYDEMKAENVAQAQAAALRWAEVAAKDERTQNRHTRASQPGRDWWYSRENWRTRQDWNRTVQGIRRQYRYMPPSEPREPYSKGWSESGWTRLTAKLWYGFFRLLGIE